MSCNLQSCIYTGTFGQEKAWTLGAPMTYQHPLNTRDLLLHTEPTSTPPPSHAQDKSGSELGGGGGDKVSSEGKSESRKLRAAVREVQTAVLTVTEMEDEVRALYIIMMMFMNVIKPRVLYIERSLLTLMTPTCSHAMRVD